MLRYSEYLDQLYKELCREPDFPVWKVEKLWETLPYGSRDLCATIYLLPFGDGTTATEASNSKAITLLTLSAFVHADLEKNRVFHDGEAVLYGDYLFALAFSQLPKNIEKERAEALLEQSYRFSECRLSHQKVPADEKESLQYAAEDYGKHLKTIAEEAARQSNMEETAKENYALCAESIGTLWGILCEGYLADTKALRLEAKQKAKGLFMADALTEIINELGRNIG